MDLQQQMLLVAVLNQFATYLTNVVILSSAITVEKKDIRRKTAGNQ
jgi:hypothetical protein